MTNWFQRFNRVWLVEVVRRYELEHGTLHDESINQTAWAPTQLTERLAVRAELLAEKLGLARTAQQWQQLYRMVWGALLLLAVVSAVAIVRSALVIQQPISLSYALLVLLGLQLAMFVLWLLSLPFKSHLSAIGRLLLWLYRRLGRDPLRQQRQNTFLSVLNQHGLTTPLAAVLSHGYWLLVMLAVWLLLALHLSTDAYRFTWATTILAPSTLQTIVDSIHWLPQQLGVTAPSITALWNEPDARLQLTAGRWLLSCVFWYGVAWRGLWWLGSLLVLLYKLRRLRIDVQLPGFAAALRQLQDSSSTTVVDADTGTDARHEQKTPTTSLIGAGTRVLSLDYEADSQWLTAHQQHPNYLGVIASHHDKQQVLEQLRHQPVTQLTVRINTQLSPDRATLRYLNQLQQFTEALQVHFVQPQGGDMTRLQHWQQQLTTEAIPWQLQPH
ncbi:Protein of unknown function [Pseudidiomarina indica]|uniref:DUF2868 domain-containing protein n=1 Tax=Pseudidiomarina indica TaxID=1159017 RepID=A0A1G6A2B7_9GAMM|nr:DUF2868 domain-containing protein [Pseudidiomarina indica]SDB02638.1 Protein of unknown function [Pseudidiomarina indica]